MPAKGGSSSPHNSTSGEFTAQNAELVHSALAAAAGVTTSCATKLAADGSLSNEVRNLSRQSAYMALRSVCQVFLLHSRWKLDIVSPLPSVHTLKLSLLKLLLQEGDVESTWLSGELLLQFSFLQPLLH